MTYPVQDKEAVSTYVNLTHGLSSITNTNGGLVDDKWNYLRFGPINAVPMGPSRTTHMPSHQGEAPSTQEEIFLTNT